MMMTAVAAHLEGALEVVFKENLFTLRALHPLLRVHLHSRSPLHTPDFTRRLRVGGIL
jgi:hypothetical protein